MKPKAKLKLIGLAKSTFDEYCNEGRIQLRKPRLIPIYKPGDENSLTSVLLSSLRLVKEFRQKFFEQIKFRNDGKAFFYTEVFFPELKEIDEKSRIDGLIIYVKKGIIKDVVFIEVKHKNESIKKYEDQIIKYYKVAQKLGNVPKILTISNDFVSKPTDSPIYIPHKAPSISLFHLSWTYIQTLSQLLLFENEENIEDIDQIEIMKEVISYFSYKDSGISGFNKMSDDWKSIVEKIKSGSSLSEYIEGTVTSWEQEEIDMSLMLSTELGVLVKVKNKTRKQRIKKLEQKYCLSSTLSVKHAVSDIFIIADLEKKTISMSVKVTPEKDDKIVGRVSWIRRQIESFENKYQNSKSLFDKLYLDLDILYAKQNEKFKYRSIDTLYDYANNNKQKDISEFGVEYIKSANFNSTKGFVKDIESMLVEFYEVIVQDLKTFTPEAPKIEKTTKKAEDVKSE